MKKYIYITMLIASCWIFFASCGKYLDAKPNAKLVTPETIEQLQGILDYSSYMSRRYPIGGEVASDNYYLTDKDFEALPDDYCRNAYIWEPNEFNPVVSDWQYAYVVVYNANIVLDNMASIERNSINAVPWDNCKGSALFFRSLAFYHTVQIWSKAYDKTTAETDLGIPLRLSPDFNIPSSRATVENTYNQIINDTKASVSLLPESPVFPYRPSKPAAYGLLARTYLAMRYYHEALLYADSCLQLRNELLDFNTLDAGSANPFSGIQFTNPEDIMHTTTNFSYNLYSAYSRVDTVLYNAYSENDLRKYIFFDRNIDGSYYFDGSYDGSISNYNGIAVDEMYLIRAECKAREGDNAGALKDLNFLLSKRFKKGTYIPVKETNSTLILGLILKERRKELIGRALRFTDIKRLNKEGDNIVLKRIIDGRQYSLPPNDSRYALPIPDNVINLAHLQQN